MPGSPPTSTADPATMPLPRTRSSSSMPVLARGGGAVSPARPTKATALPAMAREGLAPGAGPRRGVTASSTMVFQVAAGIAAAGPFAGDRATALADEAWGGFGQCGQGPGGHSRPCPRWHEGKSWMAGLRRP